MPRTVPGAISAKTGSGALFFVWLVELIPVGGSALYLSSGKSVSFGGHAYEHDRVKSVDGLTAPYIDYKNLTFGSASIVLRGLADDGSTTFPYVTLEGSINLEGARVFIHLYDVDAGAGIDAIFQGYIKTREYDGNDHTAKLEASHLWDCPGIVIPSSTLQQEGFGTLDTNEVKESVIDETTLPLFWSAGEVKIRPTIYHTRVRAAVIQVNGIISGCGPTPFDAADIVGTTIFDSTPAESITFEHRGLAADTVPDDKTKYPDGLAHNNVAYFSGRFPITDDNKGSLDNISNDAVKIRMAKGRPLIDTGLASSNGVLILKDGLRDPRFGVGMASGEFDDLSVASTLAGTWWQVRQELHEQVPVGDWVQKVLTQIHGFCTFNGRKLQIGIKNNGEASVAAYATRKSGHGGLEISGDAVHASFESADTLVNQINIKYRIANRHEKPMIAYDSNSQNRLGGTIRTVNPTSFEYDALYVADQVKISAAQWIREDQNENLRISFDTPLVEGLAPAPGDLITVWSEDIPNNASNSIFRILAQTFTTGDIPKVSFQCRVYKASAHAYSTAGIGIDLIRSGVDVSNQGRPPDVIPVSVTLLDKTTGDTQGVMGNFRALFTYPVVNLAAEQADGIFRQYPIRSVRLYCRFTDEGVGEYKLVKEVEWPTAQADFTFDFIKSKSIIVAFVALGIDRSQGPLGYVTDSSKVTALTADLSATSALALVGDAGPFTIGEYIITEFEIDKLLSKAAGQLTFENVAGVRTAQLSTTAIAHPNKTQVAAAKLNYPTLTVPLNAPRFTYPTVVLTDILQRGGDGVRVRWSDVNPDNLESYFAYWSKDADGGTNPAKLGSATPAWYIADPRTPGSGVNLKVATKQQTVVIPQEDIGPVGTPVFVRVAARNGKQNFSAALSNLGNSSVAAGGTTPPTDFLGNVDIISNTFEQTPEGLRARVVWRVYADATLTKSFGTTGTTSVQLVFNYSGGKSRPEFAVDDPTAVFIDCVCYFPLGDSVTIIKGIAWNSGGKKTSAYSFAFFAGGQTSLAGITGLAITGFVPIDDKHSYLTFVYTQPATPAIVSHALIKRQLAGEGTFTKERKVPLLSEPGNLTPGAKTFTEIVKHPKKNAIQWKITLVSVDGTTLDSAVANNTSPDVDTGPPNNGTAITINRAKIKKGGKLLVDFVLPVLQMVSHSKNVLVIHDNNFLGSGRRYYDPYTSAWVLTYPDGTTELSLAKGGVTDLHISPAEIFVGGRTTAYVRIGVYNQFNGGAVTYSGDLTATLTQAGSEADSASSDTAIPSALTSSTILFIPKVGVHVDTMVVGANWNQPRKKYLVIWDGVSVYFDLPTYMASGTLTVQAASSEANARYEFGAGKDQLTLGIRLANLRSVLGAQMRSYWYAENTVGPSLKAVDSNVVNLNTAKDVVNSKDVIVRVSSGIYPPGKQLLSNAAFLLDDGAGNLGVAAAALRWKRWDKITLPIRNGAGSFNISTVNTDPIYWNKAGRCVVFNNTSQMLVQNVQARLLPGESYSVPTIKVKSTGSPTGLELRFYFKRNDNSTDNLDNIDNPALTYGKLLLTGLSTAFTEYGIPLKFKDTPSINDGSGNYVNQILCIELVGTLGGTTVSLTDIMFERGLIPVAFDALESEIGQIAGALLPTLVPSSGELTNPVGLDGGWQDRIGLGGLVGRLAN